MVQPIDEAVPINGGGNGGSGAPEDAAYVTTAANGTLTNERVLTAGDNISLDATSTTVTINAAPIAPVKEVLLSASSIVTQEPTALDTPLQIEFGAAQGTGGDPVQISALGAVTANETGQYEFTINFEYGRSGSAQASILFFRLLIDGAQQGDGVVAILDNDSARVPAQFKGDIDLTAGQVVTAEIMRDSDGNNSGGLFVSAPTTLPWNTVPSASMVIRRFVQP